MPEFKSANTSVKRRFSDFLGLHERLASKYLHLGRIVPPAPEKSVIGEIIHMHYRRKISCIYRGY
jgi:sorting nexin-1/2